jgi:hypothetical protein
MLPEASTTHTMSTRGSTGGGAIAEVVAHISVDIGFTIEVTVGTSTGDIASIDAGIATVPGALSCIGATLAPEPAAAAAGPTGARGRCICSALQPAQSAAVKQTT